MFGILKKKNKPLIGVDLSGDCLTMAQLANGDQDTTLVAGSQASRPKDVVPGSVRWQKWAIDAMRCATDKGHFHGKDVIAALPAGEIFVDHIKDPKHQQGKLEEAVFSQIKRKLPFEPILKDTLIKCIPTEQDNVMVLATERAIVERHLAIYEHAGLAIKSIGVWPVALANCHTRLFGRRKTDLEAVVMAMDIQPDRTNLVVSRGKNPLFARSIPMGAAQLQDENAVGRLTLELSASRRQFLSIYTNVQIERLIFLSGQVVDSEVYQTLAKQLETRAQLGDCLAAVEIKDREQRDLDRRQSKASWAVAFGLSLS